jgi:hypothetical protein
MMIFISLMTAAIFVLIRGIENTAARVCRIALPVFALFYVAWEVLLGIGTYSAGRTRPRLRRRQTEQHRLPSTFCLRCE